MGTCSSPIAHSKKIRKAQKERTFIQKNNSTCHKSKNAKSVTQLCSRPQSNKKVELLQTQETFEGFPLAAFGYIVGEATNYCLQRAKQTVGLGCLISKNIILASDHYLHYYNTQDLSFKPYNHQPGDNPIKIKSCIYPATVVKQKKRSTYLHKRLGFALYELEEPVKSSQIIELGINIQEDNNQGDDYFMLENVVQESSRLYFQHRGKLLLPERGWPLLYKLYERYYCVGLYTSAKQTDYLLFNERIVEKFKSLEEKHCGTELISYIEIVDAKVEVAETGKLDKASHVLQDLMNQLETAETQEDKEQTAEILFKIGVENGIKGDLQKEKQYYHKSLELYLLSEEDQKENIASLYHNLGICESQLGFNQTAKKHLLHSLKLKQQLNLQGQSMGDTYNELGVISKNQKNYDEAIQYYNKAFMIYTQLNYTEKIGLVLNNINIIQQEDQTYNDNLSKFLGALSFLIKSKGERCLEVAEIYYNLACMECDCKNYGSSMTYLSRSLSIMKNLSLQTHYKYKTMVQTATTLHTKAIQFGLKRQWILKGKALLSMI